MVFLLKNVLVTRFEEKKNYCHVKYTTSGRVRYNMYWVANMDIDNNIL